MLTTSCCLAVELGLGLGFDLVSGWLVVMVRYLYYFQWSLSFPADEHAVARVK